MPFRPKPTYNPLIIANSAAAAAAAQQQATQQIAAAILQQNGQQGFSLSSFPISIQNTNNCGIQQNPSLIPQNFLGLQEVNFFENF